MNSFFLAFQSYVSTILQCFRLTSNGKEWADWETRTQFIIIPILIFLVYWTIKTHFNVEEQGFDSFSSSEGMLFAKVKIWPHLILLYLMLLQLFFFRLYWNSLLDEAGRELKDPPASIFLVVDMC